MRRAILLAAFLVLPRAATAAEGLFMSWDDCPLGASSSLRSFTCDTDEGAHTLICALTLDSPVDSVLGMEIVVDVQHGAASLPDWWHFEVGGCRDGALAGSSTFPGLSACVDPWQGQASGGLLSYTPTMPRGGANQARIRIALAMPSNSGLTLNAADMYYAARVRIANTGTVASPACAGCGGQACLVLNSIILRRPLRPPGVPSADVVVVTPAESGGNWVRWQDVGANCQAVPVRNATWGQIKALYR